MASNKKSVKLWRNRWAIGIYTGSTPLSLTPANIRQPVITANDVTDIKAQFVADPFLLHYQNLWYMFFEALNSETERGEIAYSTSIDCVNWSYGSVVLQEPFHLSYPQVFAHNQEIYMLPETRQDGSVRLYRAVEMPNRWECVATLLYGEFADATILHYQDLWWIFAQRGLDEMRLFWSESLTGKWYEHPQNPLWPGDRRRTRPAGRMLFYQGQLLRFAQDGWPSYGSQVRVFAVDHLSKSEYREHELDQSPILEATGTGWNGTAMHHIDAITLEDGRWLAAVDGASLALF